jgi:ankyrin repeat protein
MSFIIRSSLLIATLASTNCAMFFEVPATPLQHAAWQGDVAAIQSLVKSGVSIDEPDDMGSSPLFWAARGGHAFGPHQCRGEDATRPEVIRTLLELGANPNVQDNRPKGFGRASGWTPLFVALHHEQFKSAAVLLEHGADPNILSDQGMSAMQVATVEGDPRELIELMLAKGFDPEKARQRH